MNKRLLFTYGFSFIVLLLIVTGCSKDDVEEEKEQVAINENNENPFEIDEEDTVIMGSIWHSYANVEVDDNDEVIPLTYDGDELVIDYSVQAEGKATNIGFLVYVDGIAQPYKLNTTESAYQYMHIFDLEEEGVDTPFQFIFTPITGKEGETVNVTITSIYNPSFIPDMKETTSYGGYHHALSVIRPIEFHEKPEFLNLNDLPTNKILNDISISTEPVTDDFLEKLGGGVTTIDSEMLDTNVFNFVEIEDKPDNETNFQITDQGNLHMKLKILGHPGVAYQNTFYLNHQALSDQEGNTSFETKLTKGDVSVIDVEIDIDTLDDFSTFYVVSTPVNPGDFYENVLTPLKTPSVLLYK
ncbi:beta-glucanase/beta-glucan synthetase [Ornithinibacillus massiliensis]|uniref:Beta-glucanase/beta-glucan synthetase n=1 Tax=Ornithinibacillus massiliensis TaxID=1944633 RepID=A0ABS5MBX3_9BACI|nr:beta-glucanase/beta-glucan synthetase [Ornithinibacillus massiliensis]MBS3679827.1 beta-glucanase/beta-glucan synthetase [Ornithinibacillus massiliensis]